METWKPIYGFEGWYEISSDGRVRSLDRVITHSKDKTWGVSKIQVNDGQIIKSATNNKGYYYVRLYKNSKYYKRYVHRLVAESFIPEHKKSYKVVNHINGNHQDNRPENLEWCTQKYNIQQAFKNGLVKTRKMIRSTNILTGETKEYKGVSIAAKELGVSHSGISLCLTGKNKLCKGCTWEYM